MDSETRDVLDDAAEAGPDGYETAANAEIGELVARNARLPLDPDAVAFNSLLNIDYDDCLIGACARSTHVQPRPGKRPEMTFWDVDKLINIAASHGMALKVTAHTCTLIDRALKTAQEHSRRTQHVMLASYYYESLPGRVHGTDVVIVDDVLDTNVRPAAVGWQFVPPTPTAGVQAAIDQAVEVVPSTITADVAEIRTTVARAFNNDGDKDLPSGCTSTGDKLADELAKNHPDADARVLRVLAARIARAGVTGNEDPLCTLTDVAAALRSLTAVVAQLAGPELGDEDGPEVFKIYAETIDHLRNAADGVGEMAGWF